jgi:hypothetical protein
MMSHKIIDESHFNFHVVAKAKILGLLMKLNLPRWYHVDVCEDLEIPEDVKQKLIEEGKQWMKDHDPKNPIFK